MKVSLPVRDIIYGLLLASFVVVGGHAWYHLQHQIEVLQNNVNFLHQSMQYLQQFSSHQ